MAIFNMSDAQQRRAYYSNRALPGDTFNRAVDSSKTQGLIGVGEEFVHGSTGETGPYSSGGSGIVYQSESVDEIARQSVKYQDFRTSSTISKVQQSSKGAVGGRDTRDKAIDAEARAKRRHANAMAINAAQRGQAALSNAESKMKQYKTQAAQEHLNRIANESGERVATRNKLAMQEAAYAGSGVLMEGTPANVMRAQKVADEIDTLQKTKDVAHRGLGLRLAGQNVLTEAKGIAGAFGRQSAAYSQQARQASRTARSKKKNTLLDYETSDYDRETSQMTANWRT